MFKFILMNIVSFFDKTKILISQLDEIRLKQLVKSWDILQAFYAVRFLDTLRNF